MDYALQEGPRQVTLTTPEVELGFSRESGALTLLRRPGGQNYLGRDPLACSLDVLLPSGWMSQRSFARYLSHQVHQDATAITIVVRVGLGPLLLQDIYSITGTLLRRSLKVKNVGLDELQLMGIWQALPGACIGSPESCRFEAPANGARPRLAVETAARLRRFEAPGSDIATVVRRGRPFESAPDRGPGLLGLHGTVEQDSLLCWYFRLEQPAWPAAPG